MRPYIELYINNQKVYFKNPPEIFVTYAHTDLHNPTVVKNSYTKTVTVEGTPENNRIFNDFYDMRRMNGEGLFNPSRKEEFTLYRNGEPMESGYVKLDKVEKNNGRINYHITLYGGLGQFLYNLQYKEDGEQMKLSDLDYGSGEKEFDVEVDAKNVLYAWNRINGKNGEWQNDEYKIFDKINFAPCYNGIPKDFSADKVAIDVQSFITADDTDLSNQFVTEKDGYTTVDGWVMGELAKEYDEWEMNDLRSYMQRPVVRFKEIIQGCCRPENNGGYTVDLDSDFFSADNPYYENAWMTMPLLTEIEKDEKEISIEYINDGYKIIGAEEGLDIRLTIPFSLGVAAEREALEYRTNCNYSYASVGAGTYLEGFSDVARYIQLVAYDADGKIVGASNIKSFHSTQSGDFHQYNKAYDTTVEDVIGVYKWKEDAYKFISDKADSFDLTVNFKYVDGVIVKFVERWCVVNDGSIRANSNTLFYGYNDMVEASEWNLDAFNGYVSVVEKGYKITKKTLLNSERTPCDYFLSYLKTFNLHIWKDMYDKVIYVRTRKNFFNDEVKDLEDLVDRGDNITITPLTFENKWLCFKAEYETDEKLHKDYVDEYGLDFGIQKVDTNYSFDSSSKDILENYAFKGCITTRNRSKYYTDLHIYKTEDIQYPPFMLDGCKTYLFKGGDTTEASYITPKTTAEAKQLWSEKFYDLMPKPNFTDKNNESVEGANVLLFYNGKKEVKNNDGELIFIYITDDIPQFETLNDGEPCWIWSYNGKRPDYLPMFGRYITNENGWITHSWDFGTPKAIYVPDYKIDQSSSIYSKYWQSYMRDQYDSNTRVVECKVLLKERVVGEWLQRFYYWDGRYWVLNKITDYNPTSNSTTKCEFITVNDKTNYLI